MEIQINGINAVELVSWIDSPEGVLILDCRSSMEYGTSHIKDAVSIGGSRALRREILAGHICIRKLIEKQLQLAASDTTTTTIMLTPQMRIVIYDQTSMVLQNQQSLIYRLFEMIHQNFPRTNFLEGGFIGFQARYPSYCWVSEHKQPDEDFVPHHHHSTNSLIMDLQFPQHLEVQDRFPGSRDNTDDVDEGPSGSKIVRSTTISGFPRRPEQLPSLAAVLPGPSDHPGCLSGPALSRTTPTTFGSCGSGSSSSSRPTPVLPHLLLGSQQDALSSATLTQYNITHIINVSTDGLQSPLIPVNNFLRIPVLDNFTDKITSYFPMVFEFLDNVKAVGGRALVHCSAGISRSPTIAIAYLMKVHSKSVTEAYDIVKSIRPSISPNFNFMGQLTSYEKELQSLSPSPSSISSSRLSKKKHKSWLPSPTKPLPSPTSTVVSTRPKKRPSRLGFLSSLLVRSSSNRSSATSSTKTPPSSSSSSHLLPSPSTPFAHLGLNSPTTSVTPSSSSPPHKLLLHTFPSTSLEKLTFHPCRPHSQYTSSSHSSFGIKIKRTVPTTIHASDTSTSSNENILSSCTTASTSEISPQLENYQVDQQNIQLTSNSCAIKRRLCSLYSIPSTSQQQQSFPHITPIDTLSSSSPPPNRSASFERVDKQSSGGNGGSNGASTATISDSCRVQETHQSTSSLSSANSHSSSLLAN